MKLTTLVVACLLSSTSALAANERNPFEPVKSRGTKQADVLPFVLPPPAPPPPSLVQKRSPPSPDMPVSDNPGAEPAPAPVARSKTRDPATRIQAACTLKSKSSTVTAPAIGGTVVLSLQVMGGRECLSAVLAEQRWLEVKDLSDPSAVQLLVDVNDSELPRQSNIVLANAAQSLTIVLVQEGRVARSRP